MALFDLTFFHSQLFWLFVCFFSLLIFMYKFAGPKIADSLEERANQIRRDLEDAQKLKEESEKILASYTQKMDESKKEAKSIIDEAKKQAKELAEKEAAVLEKSLDKKSKKAAEQIESAKQHAIEEIKSEAHKIVISATEKLVMETVDAKKAKELTQKACEELN